MSNNQLHNVKFDIIRYANCWEDADVLLQGLNIQPKGRILSIGAAGDNSFSLLTTNPEIVIAVDISKVQCYLIELKALAIEKLNYTDFLGFIGFKNCNHRIELYHSIKEELKSETKLYWKKNIKYIDKGIICHGKFEQYFIFFSKWIMPFIHSKCVIKELYQEKTEEEQVEFYNTHWNTWRWRLMFKFVFNKYILGKYGRDPEFLKHVDVPVSQYILEKDAKHLKSVNSQKNYFLKFIHTGNFGEFLPHYVREENFNIIKKNIPKLIIHQGFIEEVVCSTDKINIDYSNGKGFNYFNLSNIFEYMDITQFKKVAQLILDHTRSGARFAYWNLMVNRKIKDIFPEMVNHHEHLSNQLTNNDKGFFYNQFIIDEKI